ncbi:glutathione S-transferase family protein [Aestuariirhabdus litorea]|uniref:Glutathione S-transferase family protein n=1 Tax=Aestuariirhabdus litorea TaxID=2528527 RepID=A0A3P3VMZ1_9GAMM|nr:glutathione S-transferase family protein [Aestuariirhabdus litorea]RRJ83016.1 glutathione S-transferase family protein [Aestuariirhabdus litorea]RWW93174.1 glutathione S-transferase family protein [Endozoicomonadaceae bacterium GTF-13]
MTDLTLVIGNKNYSSWSLRPWLLLRQFDIPFNEVRIPLFTPDFAEAVGRWSGAGRVPVLAAGELRVWDSLAICEYVNEHYLAGAGWPQDSGVRAWARSVCAEMHSGFANLRHSMPMNCRRTIEGFVVEPPVQADIKRITKIWRQCRERFAEDGPWLFGAFSIADAMFAPVAVRFQGYGVALPEPAQGYQQQLWNHPALQAWVEAARQESEVIEEEEV